MLPQAKLDEFRSVSGQLKSGGVDLMSWFCGHLTESSGIEAMVEGARSLGVKTVSESAERSLLDEINTACAKAGLGFGIHNHYFRDRKFLYESPEDVLSAIKGHQHIFSTLDTGHMIALGIDPTDSYRKMKGHVRIIHVKDEDVPGHTVVLGKGKGNIARFIGQLHMIHSRASSRLNTRREMIQKKKSQNAHSTFAGKYVSNRNELRHRIRC